MTRNAKRATNLTGAGGTDIDIDATRSTEEPADETAVKSTVHARDRDEVEETHRATTEQARRSAGATEGIGEPAISQEANEPTTAAADRVRFLREEASEA